jgi:hypothetical protein
MYRIIYFKDQTGYQTFDSDNYDVIAEAHMGLKKIGCKIICIVDYNASVVLNKCVDFKAHIPAVDRLLN